MIEGLLFCGIIFRQICSWGEYGLCRARHLRPHRLRLMQFAFMSRLFPWDLYLHFAAAFTRDDRDQRRNVETYIEVAFMQPAFLAYP